MHVSRRNKFSIVDRQTVIGILFFAIVLFISSSAYAQVYNEEFVSDEIIIKLKDKSTSSNNAKFLSKLQGKLSLKSTMGKLNIHHFKITNGKSVSEVINEYQADPNVEYVEPNYKLRIIDGNQVDSQASAQGSGNVTAQAIPTYQQNFAQVKVNETWQVMSASSSDAPIVAVIDTGVDLQHPVFVQSNALWVNSGEIPGNGMDDDGNGFVDDINGWNFNARTNNPQDDDNHGTHVAGIILGVGQDILADPVAVAKIRIMALKFLSADGSGSTADAINAIYYAVNNGAQVINNSWGGAGFSQSLLDAISYAYNHKVTVVNAAGNYSSNNDTTAMYPSNYAVPSAISVAATNDWDTLASFSNYGKSTVNIASPGVGIYSTVWSGNTGLHSFGFMSGTSMAAPFISGVAALVYREAPQLTGYQVKNIILNTAKPISSVSAKTTSGSRVDVLQAISGAQLEVGTLAAQPAYNTSGGEKRSLASAGGGCGLVKYIASGGEGGSGLGGMSSEGLALVISFSLLPFIVWQIVMQKATGRNRRKHERFAMNSEVKIKAGDRELTGRINTISTGGASFNVDEMLDKGGIVTMSIASPDGKEQVQVEGQVVWSEQNKSYGVQFANAKESTLDRIRNWSTNLIKT